VVEALLKLFTGLLVCLHLLCGLVLRCSLILLLWLCYYQLLL
jgi:hypothetical protein